MDELAAEAVGTVGNSQRFLRRVFQALWEQWENRLGSLIFPRFPQRVSFHSWELRSESAAEGLTGKVKSG
jgi:hypothetical protein